MALSVALLLVSLRHEAGQILEHGLDHKQEHNETLNWVRVPIGGHWT